MLPFCLESIYPAIAEVRTAHLLLLSAQGQLLHSQGEVSLGLAKGTFTVVLPFQFLFQLQLQICIMVFIYLSLAPCSRREGDLL